MRRWVRDNGLTLFFAGAFGLALLGQTVAGYFDTLDQRAADDLPGLSFGRYLYSADLAVDVIENWQSEYLQFFLYIFVTVWLVQRGSPESTKPSDVGRESDEQQLVGRYARADSPRLAKVGGWGGALFANSLGLTMGAIFVLCWLVQSIAGAVSYNEQRLASLRPPVDWATYIGSPDFWNRTLQNWQSEFLAVASMVALSIYLRQRGSSQSKPVGTPHKASAVDG